MRRKFTSVFLWILFFAVANSVNSAHAAPKKLKRDTAYMRIHNSKPTPKSSYLKGGFHINFPSIKSIINPSASKAAMAKPIDDKLLLNVQIYPNPVIDQINLKYTVTKNSNVSIKIMDVLGNSVLTLLSQRVEPGEQKFSYNLNRQLTSGFYFVRVVVGTETVIKRISVL